MKGAILISGAYKNATEPIVELLKWLRSQEGYEIDVYIHAWWDPSYVGKRYRHDHLSIIEADPSKDIQEKIQPIKYALEPQCEVDLVDLPYKTEYGGTALQRETAYFVVLSQMESLKRCFALIENPDTYDFIMRLRGDLFIENESYKIPFTKEDLYTNNVYIGDGAYFTGWPYGDWAYLARPSIMREFILNQQLLFRSVVNTLGYFPHVHTYIIEIFKMIGVNGVRWYVPLKITRLSEKYSTHLQMDTKDTDVKKDPFFWHLMNLERIQHPVE